jgi:DNA polymerase III subunit delta'
MNMNIYRLHEYAWHRLRSQRERLPHAIMLVGQRGVGKFALAHAFAASLLCESPRSDGRACGSCQACHWFDNGSHPDFRLLQPEALAEDDEAVEGEDRKKDKASQQITIAQVRELDEFLNVGTHRAGLRVVLINPAEAMNRNTANALLKSLEEPPGDTLFLLCCSEPLRLLPTIRSRCQVVAVNPPPAAISEEALTLAGIPDPGRWLALAGGSPMLAAELATAAGSGWLDILTGQLAASSEIDPTRLATDLEKILKESRGRLPLRAIVEFMQKWLIDLNLAGHGLPLRYFLPQQATIRQLSGGLDPLRLARGYRALLERRRASEQPLNARLFLEGLFIEYQSLIRH